jgi:hypothetical protein
MYIPLCLINYTFPGPFQDTANKHSFVIIKILVKIPQTELVNHQKKMRQFTVEKEVMISEEKL